MSTTTRPYDTTAPADEPVGGTRGVAVPRVGPPSVPTARLTSAPGPAPRATARGPRPPRHARALPPGTPPRTARAVTPAVLHPARTSTGSTPVIGLEAVASAARDQELRGGSWVTGAARPGTAVRWFPTFARAVRAVGRPRTARGPAPHRAQWTPASLARVPRTWRRRLVTAVAWLVVVVCVTAYAVSLLVPLWFQLHDQRVLIVTSGSMSGTEVGGFDAGDAVIMRRITDPSQLRVGQVVSFWPPGSDTLVTHRIVALHYLPVLRQDEATGRMLPTRDPVTGELVERPFIVTKGDANPAPDPDATPLSRVRGVVLDVYPGWGWVLAWARSAEGRFAMLVPPLVALAVMEVQSLLDSRRAPRPPRHRGRADDLLLG
ncbi:signal peptidase I [Cellulomonas cellasea]|uniref:Signal peptidase I n=1 Tax=Cellulomonas cellasea TaxID=43670 RepID=A0A7W4UIM2_9CELL|nr:signal peptidase I [Cellulomonas cellasea]MBB2924871.1 signal peptidase I [Cellulomonas cellasea]